MDNVDEHVMALSFTLVIIDQLHVAPLSSQRKMIVYAQTLHGEPFENLLGPLVTKAQDHFVAYKATHRFVKARCAFRLQPQRA